MQVAEGKEEPGGNQEILENRAAGLGGGGGTAEVGKTGQPQSGGQTVEGTNLFLPPCPPES